MLKNAQAMLDDEARRLVLLRKAKTAAEVRAAISGGAYTPKEGASSRLLRHDPPPETSDAAQRLARFGLAAKLFAILILLGAVAVLVTGVLGYVRARDALEQAIFNQLTAARADQGAPGRDLLPHASAPSCACSPPPRWWSMRRAASATPSTSSTRPVPDEVRQQGRRLVRGRLHAR